MLRNLVPGADGQLLPAGTHIFRVAKGVHCSPAAGRQMRAPETMFQLTSKDKASPGQRLSVWVEELTIADQAWSFLGKDPSYTSVACLNSADVCAVNVPNCDALQVAWEQAKIEDNGIEVPNTAPGAEGHSGIENLNQGGEGRAGKDKRKALRNALADIARLSPVPVPHDLDEEHLKVAAYFIHEKTPGCPDSHWISAIRQLRRERVQAERAAAPRQLVAEPHFLSPKIALALDRDRES